MSTEQNTARAAVVNEGDWVKISRNHERFWCRVVEPYGGVATGTGRLAVVVDNDLLNSDAVRCGDRLEIGASEVLEVTRAADRR